VEIGIPSKGRAGKVSTIGIFKNATLFVEPQEYNIYKQHYEHVINIGENNKGISFVRNFMLDFYNEPFGMIDDDISVVKERDGQKLKKLLDLSVVFEAIEKCFSAGYVQATISYEASNWLFKGRYKKNTRCWAVNFINPIVKARYDVNADIFEDYDFTAQLLCAGQRNVCLYEYAFGCKEMAINEGGCQLAYNRKQRSVESLKYLLRKYGRKYVNVKYNKKTECHEPVFKWKLLFEQMGA